MMQARPSPAAASLVGLACLLAIARSEAAPPDGWRIRLEASMPGLTDRGRLTLGASGSADDGYDTFDEPHPPRMPRRYLDVFTSHSDADPGWQGQPRPQLRYRAQYDSALGAANRVIGFVVESDQTGHVTLSWSLATDLELAQHYAVLRDLLTGQTTDLWAHTSYAFDLEPGPRSFQIELTGGRTAPPIAHDQLVTTNEETAVPVTLT